MSLLDHVKLAFVGVKIVAGKEADTGDRWLTEKVAPVPASQINSRESVVRGAIPTSESAGFAGLDSNSNPLPNPVGRGYCTDYAAKLFRTAAGTGTFNWGDAQNWLGKGKAAGWKTLDKSKISEAPAGAAVVWQYGSFGHVGIVVRNDGKGLLVTEANWGHLDPSFPTKWAKDNVITVRFNKHDERPLTYAQAANRGNYVLIGFVLPERIK